MAILFANAPLHMVRGNAWADDVALVDQTTGDPVDLTGIVGIIMRIREDYASPILLELSTTDETLAVGLNPAAGIYGIRANSALTRTLPENGHEVGVYVYDAVIERTAGEYEAANGGVVIVDPQVTRPWSAT